MPNERRKPTPDGSDEGITFPLDPETAFKVALGDSDATGPPPRRPPKKSLAKRTHSKP